MTLTIGVTEGMSGWYAVLYGRDGIPVQTGIGRYQTRAHAESEAVDWSWAEGIPLDASVTDHQRFNLERVGAQR